MFQILIMLILTLKKKKKKKDLKFYFSSPGCTVSKRFP